MPVSPEMAEDLAARVRELYDAAEVDLLERLAKALVEGIDSPAWAQLKLAAVGDLRRAVEDVTRALEQDANGAVRLALAEAYQRGEQAALVELGAVPVGNEAFIRRQLPGAAAVDRLAASYARDTRPLYARITRAVVDVFRSVVTRASGGVLLGTETRRQASQRVLNQLTRNGVTAFTDRAGRNWNVASYAEMAVRSVTARAAIEGHTDRLAELGVGLVMVSDAPLECPLCARWEGEVLALAGEPGPRTVRVEHATEDGRTVAVHVVGTLVEARAAGLFHPNCRHSLSAYIPGVTTRPHTPPTPGTTYEDTQRQRQIERHIRAWKRRQAAALTDDERRAAGRKVREWQKALREHLAEHDALRRKREREQLPKAAAPAPPTREQAAAVRVRTDPGALREMSEDDLAAAMRSPQLDADDFRQIEAEIGQREEQRRRDSLFPGGRLVDDVTGYSEDDLGWALRFATFEEAERIAAEIDRRYPPAALPSARGAATVEGQLADRAAVDELLAPAEPEDWAHLALAPDIDRDDLSREERWLADRQAAADAGRSAYTRAQVREMYREHVYAQYLDAEDALRGVLLSRQAEADGMDPISMFTGPSHIAYARASEELKRWWQDHPRTTLAEYTEQVTGQRSSEGDRARKARGDQQNRL
ncbi:phage minor capsid protein [Streptomyces sp. NPDC051940]|uniref:phage minor capsid protein n=1 Tax=Streptomyces sp. NPDC051940 TaxID=3155675 RepID=UPI00344829BF